MCVDQGGYGRVVFPGLTEGGTSDTRSSRLSPLRVLGPVGREEVTVVYVDRLLSLRFTFRVSWSSVPGPKKNQE